MGWDHLWVLDQLPQGEADCHLLFEREAPGGCALNTACCLQALGAPVTLDGNFVGSDSIGARIREYLSARGIDSRITVGDFEKSPVCHVQVEQKSGRRNFILAYANIQKHSPGRMRELIEESRNGRYSHAFVQVYLRELTREYLEGVQDVRDLWILTQDIGADSPFVAQVDAIQNSLRDEDAFDAETLTAYVRPFLMREGRLQAMVVTAGARGVAWCEKGQAPRLFPGLKGEKVVDTTGCGDAFRAGLMKGLFDGLPVERAIEEGQRAGIRKAGVYGSHF